MSTTASSPIRFLICTDNHLGYNEKDPICSRDSFEAFEELLRIARDRQVDAILHCGDLFHENKPSRQTLHSTIELIRRYSLGDLPCALEYLSDAQSDFGYPSVNFQDPDINVAIPIFAIHGNHDDPVGEGNLSAWNLLAATRLVNYFGKASNLDDIKISPILLRKGNVSVALYGLGNVRDERLHRSFQQQKVSFLHPLATTDDTKWFNLMMIHQNRIAHSRSNYIPEEFLDPLLNLVIWGHEHESILEPQLCPKRGFHVIQPGSSVATSLCDAEAHAKYAAIVSIGEGGKWGVEKIELQSVRPFLMADICLASCYGNVDGIGGIQELAPPQKRLNAFLVREVEKLLLMEQQQRESSLTCDKLPLVRLRVDYSGGFPTLNPQCFGHQFVGKIANPRDILHFYRKRARSTCHGHSTGEKERNLPQSSSIEGNVVVSIEGVMKKSIAASGNGWEILPPGDLMERIRQYVEKDDKDAIERWVGQRLALVNERAKNCNTLGLIREKIGEIDREREMKEKGVGGMMVRGFSSSSDDDERESKIIRLD